MRGSPRRSDRGDVVLHEAHTDASQPLGRPCREGYRVAPRDRRHGHIRQTWRPCRVRTSMARVVLPHIGPASGSPRSRPGYHTGQRGTRPNHGASAAGDASRSAVGSRILLVGTCPGPPGDGAPPNRLRPRSERTIPAPVLSVSRLAREHGMSRADDGRLGTFRTAAAPAAGTPLPFICPAAGSNRRPSVPHTDALTSAPGPSARGTAP